MLCKLRVIPVYITDGDIKSVINSSLLILKSATIHNLLINSTTKAI